MKRILEPELMEAKDQARAYAAADFEEAHSSVIRHYQTFLGVNSAVGHVLDLGCGTADITIRFARAHPRCVVHGVDGSEAMLAVGHEMVRAAGDVSARIELFCGYLPATALPRERYDVIISNSLLHHLPRPSVLWDAVKRFAVAGAPVFVMDLFRPATPQRARELVDAYAKEEPDVLRRDFFNSLCAAFEVGEIEAQLRDAGLDGLSVNTVSDRHVVVAGRVA